MKLTHLYVEGPGDLIFICQFLAKHFDIQFDVRQEIIEAVSTDKTLIVRPIDLKLTNGGIDGKRITALANEIKAVNAPTGISSIVLIDADTPHHSNPQGGCTQRQAYLGKLLAGTDTKFFIIPNNNEDGNLEHLLSNMIGRRGKKFYQCLSTYIDGLKEIREESLANGEPIPVGIERIKDFNKQRIDWYIFMMVGIEKSGRDYRTDIWDMDSASLVPLRRFFESCFTDRTR